MKTTPAQLSFEEIFAQEERENATKHLPADMEQAIPFYRGLIEQFNAALLNRDYEAAIKVQDEAHELACKLNGGTNLGIKGGQDAPCYVLERATHAADGTVPLWGQTGEFVITVKDARVRIEMDGMFGTGAMPIPGFGAHAVDFDKPFISETGFRSFLGYQPDLTPGMTPDAFAKELITHYVARDCKGKLRAIKPEYRRPSLREEMKALRDAPALDQQQPPQNDVLTKD